MSILFFHDEEQKALAMASRDIVAAGNGGRIYTEIFPFREFFKAEDYHQKYRLRSERDLMMEFRTLYPVEEDLMNSTAAARINGYLGGYGSFEELREALPGFGLTPVTRKKLIDIVKSRKGRAACKL